MLAPLALTCITAGMTLGVIAALRREEERGYRFFEQVRIRIDFLAVRIHNWMGHQMPHLDNQFLRQLFHYLTNKVLSVLLGAIKRIEKFVLRAIQFNRQKAKKARTLYAHNSHLGEIAEHKKNASLSEEEKHARREAALNGEV